MKDTFHILLSSMNRQPSGVFAKILSGLGVRDHVRVALVSKDLFARAQAVPVLWCSNRTDGWTYAILRTESDELPPFSPKIIQCEIELVEPRLMPEPFGVALPCLKNMNIWHLGGATWVLPEVDLSTFARLERLDLRWCAGVRSIFSPPATLHTLVFETRLHASGRTVVLPDTLPPTLTSLTTSISGEEFDKLTFPPLIQILALRVQGRPKKAQDLPLLRDLTLSFSHCVSRIFSAATLAQVRWLDLSFGYHDLALLSRLESLGCQPLAVNWHTLCCPLTRLELRGDIPDMSRVAPTIRHLSWYKQTFPSDEALTLHLSGLESLQCLFSTDTLPPAERLMLRGIKILSVVLTNGKDDAIARTRPSPDALAAFLACAPIGHTYDTPWFRSE